MLGFWCAFMAIDFVLHFMTISCLDPFPQLLVACPDGIVTVDIVHHQVYSLLSVNHLQDFDYGYGAEVSFILFDDMI
jgi:hypothetical protein